MKALRWHGKGDIRIDEIPTPVPGPDEVLIKVTYSGICGSEVHEYLAGPIMIPLEPHPLTGSKAPQTMGHEFGGNIVEKGSNVTSPDIGQCVTVNPILACGQCANCRRNRPNLCEKLAYYGLIGDGGHAEYAVVKAVSCIPLAHGVPGEYVAFGEPAGIAAHAINQARLKSGSTVAVIGGGPIGQMMVQYARAAGAEKVYLTEIAPFRIELAKKIGAVDKTLNPIETDVAEEILSLTGGQGVDYAFECCGGIKKGKLENTATQAVELTRVEGTTVIVGTFSEPTNFHFNNIVFMERMVIGSWVWHSNEEYASALQKIVDGTIQVLPLISNKVRVEKAVDDGIVVLSHNKDNHMKIVVDLT